MWRFRDVHERTEDTKPRLRGFLRVELDAVHMVAFDDRGEGCAVGRGCDARLADRRRVGVREVHLLAVGGTPQKHRRPCHLQRVPSDVRYLQGWRQQGAAPWTEAEAR